MTYIAGANVLFPLPVGGHGAHASAWRWWEQQPDGSVGLCLLMPGWRPLHNRSMTPDTAPDPITRLQEQP